MFVAQKKQILNHQKDSWDKMEVNLSRGNNIAEGHYAEHSWPLILLDVDNESARAVDEVLLPHIVEMKCGEFQSHTLTRKNAQITIP